ncbi:MAG: hypothetical protein LM522_13475 [Candidatus Contendobacter sp.]|nr:hypothetical protein [Candidatus Contendobacter sp.]
MTLALHSYAVVDNNHAITLQALELRPGDRVEIIVLVEQGREAEKKGGQSFLDAIADIEIGAPDDCLTTFKNSLYANR